MEENNIHNDQEGWQKYEKNHRRGKLFGGLLIVAAGVLFLAKELGAEIPHWIFTWKIFLIAVGLTIGVKHKFMHAGWFILVLIGVAFLISDFYPGIALKPILWPVMLILFGLFVIFKPRRRQRERYWKRWHRHHEHYQKYGSEYAHHYKGKSYADACCTQTSDSNEDVLEYVTFMGGIKKNVLTKNFKGGDVVAVFGGTELNMLQADFEDTATLEITCVFAGVKLIIPANWEIVNAELVSAFGSVEDKRPVQPKTGDPVKTLVLKGNVFFGGIDIKSY